MNVYLCSIYGGWALAFLCHSEGRKAPAPLLLHIQLMNIQDLGPKKKKEKSWSALTYLAIMSTNLQFPTYARACTKFCALRLSIFNFKKLSSVKQWNIFSILFDSFNERIQYLLYIPYMHKFIQWVAIILFKLHSHKNKIKYWNNHYEMTKSNKLWVLEDEQVNQYWWP